MALTKKRELHPWIIALVVGSLFSILIGLRWDLWWHVIIGTEFTFQPPHSVAFAGLGISIVLSLYGWCITRRVEWARILLVVSTMPFFGFLNIFFHSHLEEDHTDLVHVLWYPPHLFYLIAFSISLLLTLPLIKTHVKNNKLRIIVQSISLASFLTITASILYPIYPSGPINLIGMWGILGAPFLYMFTLLLSSEYISKREGVIYTIVFIYLILIIPSHITNPLYTGLPEPNILLKLFRIILMGVPVVALWNRSLFARGVGTAISLELFFILGLAANVEKINYSLFETGIILASPLIAGFLAALVVKQLKKF